jgi:hypothetical protein
MNSLLADAATAQAIGYDRLSAAVRPVRTYPTYETQTLLTWIAARTTRIGIVPRVLAVPFRRPALVAKSASAGREVVDETSFGHWFQPGDHIQDVLSVAIGRVGNCEYLGYRLRVDNADGDFIVEQHAYCTLAKAGRIGWIRMLCSGYQPDPDIDAAQHDMDAGAHAIPPRGRQLAIDTGAGSVLPVPGSRAE